MSSGTAPISVVITCFDEGAYIEEAVESVLNQTRSDLIAKIIIIDDGSKEDTLRILNSVATLDPRIEIIFQHGTGLARNRNIASESIESDWIALLDGDDVWLPEKLEQQWPACQVEQVGLVYTYFFSALTVSDPHMTIPFVYDHSRSPDTLRDYFRFDGPVIPSTVLMRRPVFEASGGFDPAIKVFEDTDLFSRMASIARFYLVSEPLVMKRRRPGAITSQRNSLMPHHAFVAFLISGRNPRLLPILPRRLADRARKLGNLEIEAGNRSAAIRYYRLAVSLRPFSLLLWVLLAATICRLPLGDLREVAVRLGTERRRGGGARA